MKLDRLREKKVRYVVGMMSGTSCDGIDAALVRIEGVGPGQKRQLGKFATFPYSSGMRTRLLAPSFSAREICLLNFELGERFAYVAGKMIEASKKLDCRVDLIASHGHTIAHIPPRPDEPCGTLQIGEAAVIAERTSLPVVSDFRPRDMAAGGQGAPLIPYTDWLMFSRPDRTIACLNIGGIANFTVVPPELSDVIAFDTGPGNMAIDGAVRFLTRGTQQMDEHGEAALAGNVIEEFHDYLLDHPYFKRVPPKSTGREDFGVEVYLRDALNSRKDHSFEDLIATITAATADSIIQAYERFIKSNYDIARLIVGGGGVKNKALMQHLKEGLPHLRTSDQYGIPHDAREAIAFAVLGNETLAGNPGNVPKATGARHPVVLGKITPN
ncbi:MAG TPA: anhydro-N-acetylmuramic acid kinase [Candidatus Hydrogenedentes bacterium]|nr:anhydro-N-acetylmuramic acid kinase [Candidatus Hydrogenedentota bacterium]